MNRRLVVDANRVFSAILKDGETRRAMMNTSAELFAPRFLRREIEKHKAEIIRRTGASVKSVDAALAVLYRRIAWVKDDEIARHIAAAEKAMGSVDPNDVAYLACGLAVDADAIWSRDTDFDKQELLPRVAHPDAPIPGTK